MKYIFSFLLITTFVLLCACSQSPKTGQIETLVHQPVDLGDNYVGVGGFLSYCKDFIVGIELSPAVTQPFFKLTQDGVFSTFGSKGRGPNEFLMPFSLQHVDDQTIGVFDVQTRLYSEFAVPREGESPIIKKEVRMQSSSTRVIKTAFGQYIALLSLDERQFSLIDSTGVQIATFFEYPYRDNAERENKSRSMAYQGTIAANPSKTKFVYSSFFGEIIHFYSISENNIEVICKIEKEYPLYRDSGNGNVKGVSYDPDGEFGYIATYATDQFVYAVYSSETALEHREREGTNLEGDILRVFDWNGVLIKEYKLDVPCGYLCVSDDDTKIWAIATNNEGEIILVSFDLEKSMKNGNDQVKSPDERESNNSSFAERKPPPGVNVYGIDVRTKDNQHNEETKKVLDSIKNLPRGVSLDLRPNDRWDARVDTINNVRTTVLILK